MNSRQEARFLSGGRAVATGSDCGHFFIWEKGGERQGRGDDEMDREDDEIYGRLLRKVRADGHVVNGLAAHPWLPAVVITRPVVDI